MKKLLILAIAIAFDVAATEAQSPTLDERLGDLELRTSKFISGKEKMAAGFARLPPNLRQAACGAYPVKSDEEAIATFRRKIADIEASGSATHLSPEQAARLSAQKETVSRLSPGIDCSKL